MSLGGLSMETEVAFPVGSVHDFSLTLGDGASVMVKGEVVYSRPASPPDGSPLFVTGVRFVDEGEDTADPGEIISRVS